MNKISQILCAVSQTKKIKGNLNSDLGNKSAIDRFEYVHNISVPANSYAISDLSQHQGFSQRLANGYFPLSIVGNGNSLALTYHYGFFNNKWYVYIKNDHTSTLTSASCILEMYK